MNKHQLHHLMPIVVLAVLVLNSCNPPVLNPTSIPPGSTPVTPTLTSTPVQSTPTTTAVPTSISTLNPQAEQARAFVDPILNVVTNYPPQFYEDFSTDDRGWEPFVASGEQCPFSIEDGVLRVRLDVAACQFSNQALTQKDFVMQLDSRLVTGDVRSLIKVHFRDIPGFGGLIVHTYGIAQTWNVGMFKPLTGGVVVAEGVGIVGSIGETTQVLIVARGPRTAVYLNGTPVAYFEDADFDTVGTASFWCESTSQTVCEFDNIKLWELAKIPGLP
jgi:hypothetical protein